MIQTTIVIRLDLPVSEDESYDDWIDRISRRVCGRCLDKPAQRLEEVVDERSLENEPGYLESTRPYLF